MQIHFFEILLILAFVLDYKIPFLMWALAVVLYYEHLRMFTIDIILKNSFINQTKVKETKDQSDEVRSKET